MSSIFPWIPGIDIRPPLVWNLIRDYQDANAAIDAKASRLNWIGAVKGEMRFIGTAYVKEYEHASIFSPADANRRYTQAFEVHGRIRDRYNALGGSKSVLGAPVSDQLDNGDGRGQHNRFQNGAIYWSATTDAFEVYGAILARWASLGGVRSWLGYPLSGELDIPGGRMSNFENTQIVFRNGTASEQGWRDVIVKQWNNEGGVNSRLGLPLDPAMPVHRASSAMSVNFRGGVIIMNFDSPDPKTFVNTTVRVVFTGLECQVKQESNDELIGAVSAWVQPTRQIRAIEFPPTGTEEWKLGDDNHRIMTAYGVVYEGPPAGLVLSATLLENDTDDLNAGAWADEIAARHTSVRTGSINVMYDRVSGHAGNGLEAALSREATPRETYGRGLFEEFDPNLRNDVASYGVDADHYPTGLVIARWDSFGKPKQTLRRSEDPHTLTWTEQIRVEARDDQNDLGVYVFYFDISVV